MYYLVRTKDDGTLAAPLPFKFDSRAEAEAKAPVILMGRKGGGGPIILVQAIAAVDFTPMVKFKDIK